VGLLALGTHPTLTLEAVTMLRDFAFGAAAVKVRRTLGITYKCAVFPDMCSEGSENLEDPLAALIGRFESPPPYERYTLQVISEAVSDIAAHLLGSMAIDAIVCTSPFVVSVPVEEPQETVRASAASDPWPLATWSDSDNVGSSKLFSLHASTLLHALEFLALPEIGHSLASVCRFLQGLRGSWPPWKRFAEALRPTRIRLPSLHSRRLEELGDLAEDLQRATKSFKGNQTIPPDPHTFSYSELPLPRVVWSLHSEGLSQWRRVCSSLVDAEFAILPPWDRAPRRSFLPRKVQMHLGVSLWLPPEEVGDPRDSFPMLKLRMALAEPQHFEALAERHPQQPPCISAKCDAVLLRLPSLGREATLEEWNCQAFCFGQAGYHHSGYGALDGYRYETATRAKKRWRPPDLCFARAGEERSSASLHLLLRSRRCFEGLFE
ncbi:alkbh5, partial [Symbiodinium sp. CCMP2592]